MKNFFILIFTIFILLNYLTFCKEFNYISIDDIKNIQIFFLPQDSNKYRTSLVNDITSLLGTGTTVYISMYSFTDTYISSSVIDIVKSGCVVYLIIDPTQASTTNIDEQLELEGVFVKRKKSSTGFMHDKFMLIEQDKIIWTGSANWSISSLSQDNNVLRLKNFTDIYNLYKEKFLWLWNK